MAQLVPRSILAAQNVDALPGTIVNAKQAPIMNDPNAMVTLDMAPPMLRNRPPMVSSCVSLMFRVEGILRGRELFRSGGAPVLA